MLKKTFVLFFSFLTLSARAATTIGQIQNPSGHIQIQLPAPGLAINFLEFKNLGTGDVSIQNIRLVGEQQVLDLKGTPLWAGMDIDVGNFKTCPPANFQSVEFDVIGQTEALEIKGFVNCGSFPGGFSAGN